MNARHRVFAFALEANTLAESLFHTYAWLGSLVNDKENATWTLYRRNRYVDPLTGQFTQEDPIGLAGGLNLYGFAGGDPVNFSDPFGLRVCDPPDSPACKRERIEGPVTTTDPGLADPILLVGGLAGAGRALAGRLFAREATVVGETVLFEGGKAATKAALDAGIAGVNAAQASGIRQAVREGSADLIRTVTGENGLVTYSTRAGRDGYQTLVRMYNESGGVRRMAQAAWNAAGRFVHGEVWK